MGDLGEYDILRAVGELVVKAGGLPEDDPAWEREKARTEKLADELRQALLPQLEEQVRSQVFWLLLREVHGQAERQIVKCQTQGYTPTAACDACPLRTVCRSGQAWHEARR